MGGGGGGCLGENQNSSCSEADQISGTCQLGKVQTRKIFMRNGKGGDRKSEIENGTNIV